MEDWQGCLSPACQAALQNARNSVIRRGGYAVTLEDFLLSMLDEIPTLSRFLQRQGVDLDELTRTIQCEQPIVTAVACDNLLSSQLTYWIYCARQMTDSAWLEWPELFQALVGCADRLREKAYVAVLELVTRWPIVSGEAAAAFGRHADSQIPVKPAVIADAGWARLSEDVGVALSTRPDGLFWVVGAAGSGKSSWLESMIPTLRGGAIVVDIRREADVLASEEAVIPGHTNQQCPAPTLVLDNVSPADLESLMNEEFSVTRELVVRFPGPILLLSPEPPDAEASIARLEHNLGRTLNRFPMVGATVAQKQAILTIHQPLIEKRWQIELAPGVIEYVASCQCPIVAAPGKLLQWVDAAAARLHLFAERGPLEAEAMAGQMDSCRRQLLLAMARQQPTDRLYADLDTLAIERAAIEVAWHERKRLGVLRLLGVDDLKHELDLRVAAAYRSGHYTGKFAETRELELA